MNPMHGKSGPENANYWDPESTHSRRHSAGSAQSTFTSRKASFHVFELKGDLFVAPSCASRPYSYRDGQPRGTLPARTSIRSHPTEMS